MKHWSPFTFVVFGLLILLAVAGNIPGTFDPLRPNDPPLNLNRAVNDNNVPRNLDGNPRLSADTEQHILYGDESGGGHIHGAGRPCKTEFPADWDAVKIITTVKQLAANDNAEWRKEDNGYYVAEQPYEGLDVRVVLDREGDDVVTSYPTNLPRNPCE
jgi:hypothetical protein